MNAARRASGPPKPLAHCDMKVACPVPPSTSLLAQPHMHPSCHMTSFFCLGKGFAPAKQPRQKNGPRRSLGPPPLAVRHKIFCGQHNLPMLCNLNHTKYCPTVFVSICYPGYSPTFAHLLQTYRSTPHTCTKFRLASVLCSTQNVLLCASVVWCVLHKTVSTVTSPSLQLLRTPTQPPSQLLLSVVLSMLLSCYPQRLVGDTADAI